MAQAAAAVIRGAAVAKDAQSPRDLGYEAGGWVLKGHWPHAQKGHGVKAAYPTAARNFTEMGIASKAPRPRRPKAASKEPAGSRRAARQRS